MLEEDAISDSLLAKFGNLIAWVFAPLGFGNWQATVASITGLVAKENIVGTMGILYGGEGNAWAALAAAFTTASGMSFLLFNLLCAPCFAAIGAIKREMNNAKWTWFAIGYECGFAYVVSFVVYHIMSMIAGNGNMIGLVISIVLIVAFVWLLFRPYKEATTLKEKAVA